MANSLAVADIVRINIRCYVPGSSQASTNVLNYYVNSLGGSGTTDQNLSNAYLAALSPLLLPMMGSDAFLQGIRTQIISPVAHRRPYVLSSSGAAGTGGTITTPTQTTSLIKGTTPNYHETFGETARLRAPEARMYVAFPPIAAVNPGGNMSSPYYASLNTLVGFIYTTKTLTFSGGSVTIEPVVKYRDGVETFGYEFITGTYASPSWATQQRRGQRGRRESGSLAGF